MFNLALLLLCASALASTLPRQKPFYEEEDAEKLFEDFINKHNKNYVDDIEKQKRLEIFKQSLKEINRRNADHTEHATFDITRFSDLTTEEFVRIYTGTKPSNSNSGSGSFINVTGPVTMEVPSSFDWRSKNVVTGVKNQGNCGSCWCFSVTGAVEGAHAIATGELITLSEQQILDCDTTGGGCNGGYVRNAISYLAQAGGSTDEATYPYETAQGTCRFSPSQIKAKVTSVTNINIVDEEALKEVLINNGPISIVVNADHFNKYSGGIFRNCGNGPLNHAVLLVGYGSEDGIPYWLIKNSYGVGFGEEGYIRVEFGVNACGLRNDEAAGAVVS